MLRDELPLPGEGESIGPSVSALVVNFNGGERVLRCLEALLGQSYSLGQVVVVDNGSSDRSVGEIRRRFPIVEVLELGRNFGLPKARNVGLAHVRADLVLSLDSDMYLAGDCLARLMQTYLAHRPAVICPRTVLYEDCATVQCDGAEIHFSGTLALRHGLRRADGLPQDAVETGAAIGGCLLLDREKTLAAGGFDEAFFFYFEDLEFSYRMRALGYTIFCDPGAVALHDRGAGTPGLSFRGTGPYPARRAYLTMRHRRLAILLHYEARTLFLLLPAFLLYEAASLAVSLGRGWIGEWFAAWGWQARNLGDTLRKRHSLQRRRRQRDRQILAGGPLPAAPGFVTSGPAQLSMTILSALLNGHWKLARHFLSRGQVPP